MATILSKAQVDEAIQRLLGAAKSYSDTPEPEGHAARVEMLAQVRSLNQSLLTPDMMPFYHGLNMAELVDVRTFMKLGVLEAIPQRGSISLRRLSHETGVQESLLERMARNLVMSGFLQQTRPDGGEYRHSKFSRAYRIDSSGTGPGHLFLVLFDYILKPFVDFDDYFAQRGQLQNAREPDDALYSPFSLSRNQGGTCPWTILSQDPEQLRMFQMGMRNLDLAVPAVGSFDFDCLRNTPEEEAAGRIQLVDVGGGHGVVLGDILDAHPDALRPETCVLQDRPDVIELSKINGALPAEVQRIHHDFMTEQPVKGAKAYFMRMIIHDWPDAVCVQILAHLAAAMALDSRVLIFDSVLPQRVDEANFFAAVVDHAVMAIAGKERTEEDFSALLNEAGLELVRVWQVPGNSGAGACIEGRLRRRSERL
ncbi:hypothetical protein XA68_12372 [Ophiocordyceps unilateralis]|uniref:Uncharacterized protein n=1 Tax=Ophiocordyceps unilateralis TaxID=268505 RepID=A0A2A9PN87_OPHUN|nr:hypothetical protein XA68_12372 [Ophiocordyceps unilateralis]